MKNIRQLREVLGDGLDEAFYADLEHDQAERATMSMLVPPQMVNTMVPGLAPSTAGFTEALYADPVRRYMIPVFSDRRTDWPSHPYASRDSLHEAEMWAVEGLTHRYPTKVLAEVLPTCPQYCGHCTRMDLVGNPTPVVDKHKFGLARDDRLGAMIDYLRATPGVRDVVVSGGDVANLPWPRLEAFVADLLEIESVRDIRLATKALMGLPQYWLHRRGAGRHGAAGRHRPAARRADRDPHPRERGPVGHPAGGRRRPRPCWTPASGTCATRACSCAGSTTAPTQLLDLCFALLDDAKIMPYYFYMCDMIPNASTGGSALGEAQQLQHKIMGYLPGFATPRIICDVPYVGKRWVHQVGRYDTERGISYWTKNYRTGGRGRRPGRAGARVRVLRPDLPASRVRAGLVAGQGGGAGRDRGAGSGGRARCGAGLTFDRLARGGRPGAQVVVRR